MGRQSPDFGFVVRRRGGRFVAGGSLVGSSGVGGGVGRVGATGSEGGAISGSGATEELSGSGGARSAGGLAFGVEGGVAVEAGDVVGVGAVEPVGAAAGDTGGGVAEVAVGAGGDVPPWWVGGGRAGIGTNSPGRQVWGILSTAGSFRKRSAWPQARQIRVPRESSPRERMEREPPPIVPVLRSFTQTKSPAPQFVHTGGTDAPFEEWRWPIDKNDCTGVYRSGEVVAATNGAIGRGDRVSGAEVEARVRGMRVRATIPM